MSTSDFIYVPVNHNFTTNDPIFERDFEVDLDNGESLVNDEAYLLITVRSVDLESHRIRINNVELSGFDIPLPPGNSNAWFTYMDRINPGALQPGPNNELEIRREGNDNFEVKDVVIHWRKQ